MGDKMSKRLKNDIEKQIDEMAAKFEAIEADIARRNIVVDSTFTHLDQLRKEDRDFLLGEINRIEKNKVDKFKRVNLFLAALTLSIIIIGVL